MKNINKKIILASTLIALFASCGSSGGSSNIKPNIPKAMKVPKKDIENINAMINSKPTASAPAEGYKVQEDEMEMDDEVAYTVVDPIKYQKDWSEFTGDLTSKKEEQTVFKLVNSKQFFYHGKLDIKGTKSIGILAEDSKSASAINDGTINVEGDSSKGMVGNTDSSIESNGSINVGGKGSIGILTKGNLYTNKKNGGAITVTGDSAIGIKQIDIKEKLFSRNEQDIFLKSDKSKGMYGVNSLVLNNGGSKIKIFKESAGSVAMYGENGSRVINMLGDATGNLSGNALLGKKRYQNPNNAFIEINSSSNTGIEVTNNSLGYNEGIITLNGSENIGMLARGPKSKGTNYGTIEITGKDSVAMEARGGATVENDGDIILPGTGKNILENAKGIIRDSATNMKQFNDNHGNSAFKIDANSKFINKGSITFKGNK